MYRDIESAACRKTLDAAFRCYAKSSMQKRRDTASTGQRHIFRVVLGAISRDGGHCGRERARSKKVRSGKGADFPPGFGSGEVAYGVYGQQAAADQNSCRHGLNCLVSYARPARARRFNMPIDYRTAAKACPTSAIARFRRVRAILAVLRVRWHVKAAYDWFDCFRSRLCRAKKWARQNYGYHQVNGGDANKHSRHFQKSPEESSGRSDSSASHRLMQGRIVRRHARNCHTRGGVRSDFRLIHLPPFAINVETARLSLL